MAQPAVSYGSHRQIRGAGAGADRRVVAGAVTVADKILTTQSTIQCPHGGRAILTTKNAVVFCGDVPALVVSDVHQVAGCAFTLPNGKPSPCVKIEWSNGSSISTADDTALLTSAS